MVAIAAMLVMVAFVAFAAIVPVPMVATTAMVASALVAPKDLRRIHSAAFEISTRAGLVQTYIEYYSSIRTGHGQNEANHHS
jgi:hypothetical protein